MCIKTRTCGAEGRQRAAWGPGTGDTEDVCVKGVPLPSRLLALVNKSQETPQPFPPTLCLLTGQRAALRARRAALLKVGWATVKANQIFRSLGLIPQVWSETLGREPDSRYF